MTLVTKAASKKEVASKAREIMFPQQQVFECIVRPAWLHRKSNSANQWSFTSCICSLWTLSWSMNFVNQSEWFWLDCFLWMSANEWSFSEIRNGKRFILASSESRNRRQNFSFPSSFGYNTTAFSLPVMILRSLILLLSKQTVVCSGVRNEK